MTLRTRFLLSLLLVAGGALVIVGGVVHVEISAQLEGQFDRELVARLRRAAPVGSQAGALPVGICAALRQVELVDEQGRLISRCPGTRLPKASEGSLREALVKGQALRTIEVDKTRVRMILMPLSSTEEERRLLLHGAEPMQSLTESTATSRNALLMIFGGALIFVVLVSYIVRHGAISRIGRIADIARGVLRGDSPGNLHEYVADDEFGSLVRTVDDGLKRIERATAVQRRFMSDAARELMQPLTDLRKDLDDLLSREHSPEELRADLARALQDTNRLGRLIDALSLLARIDAGLERVPPDARADLGEVVKTVLGTVGSRLQEQGTKLETELQPDAVVRGLPPLLEILVQSLLVNAAHHADTGGRVRVSVAGNGSSAHLTVEDNGPAIAPEDRERIFARYARGTGGGLGLGLALARDIVRLQGGDITVGDSPLGGPRFDVELPRAA
jgi:signal transduction histidine kinase